MDFVDQHPLLDSIWRNINADDNCSSLSWSLKHNPLYNNRVYGHLNENVSFQNPYGVQQSKSASPMKNGFVDQSMTYLYDMNTLKPIGVDRSNLSADHSSHQFNGSMQFEAKASVPWNNYKPLSINCDYGNNPTCEVPTTVNASSTPNNGSLLISMFKDMGLIERKLTGRGRFYYKLFGLDCTGNVQCTKLAPSMCSQKSSTKLPQTSYKSPNSFAEANTVKNNRKSKMECVFCKNLPSNNDGYKTHWLKDSQNKIICPVLRAYRCPLCDNKGGPYAHTIRYCPLKRQRFESDFKRLKAQNCNEEMGKDWTDNTFKENNDECINNQNWNIGTIISY